jgi:AcrR family transcriptional regulator
MEKIDCVKDRIVRLASDRMLRYGIKSITVDELAWELGISKKTIYHHFQEKKEIVEAVIEDFMAEVIRDQEILLKEAANPVDKLVAMFSPIYRMMSKIDPVFLGDLARIYPELWERVNAMRAKRLEILCGVIHDGVRKKVFRNVKPEIITNLLISAITNFIRPDNILHLGITPSEGMKTLFTTFFLGLIGDNRRKEMLEKLENLDTAP